MFIKWDAWFMQLKVITNYVCFYILIFICLVIHLIIYIFAFFRWVVSSCKPYLSHNLLMILGKSMLESFSFRPWALDLLPVKCSYVMVNCSFSLALCTENKASLQFIMYLCDTKTCQTLVNLWLKRNLKGIHWLSSYYCHFGYYIRIILLLLLLQVLVVKLY